ncbi:Uncharacterized protein SCF082_LOCUS24342 [Durusdinium trenchii]|uniref:Uncharacterized protein n=1 Tax=Durusdinium trenchii TaxID=1381693 RepID=A0ABP0LSU1_9DINO
MCQHAWANALGVGRHRLGRCRHTFQGRDGRSMTGSGPAAPPAVKAASVTNFLIHLYWSAAEPMSTGLMAQSNSNKDDEVLREELFQRLIDAKLIRDWCKLMPSGATLKNCYRARKGDAEENAEFAVPQSFTFMCREGMPGGGYGMALDEHVPRRLRSDGNAKDVFCMVKASMSDDHLIQPPLLVYPDCFLQTTQHFINRINSTDELLSPCLEQARRDELSALADHIQQDFSHLQRAVQYLKALAGEDRVVDKLVVGAADEWDQRPTLQLIPNTTLQEFWLPLSSFNVSASSKSGYFPQNTQFQAHFREFLKNGYKTGAESIECMFPAGDSTRAIHAGSVGISDGFCKVLIMTGICMICHHLDLLPEELALPGVRKVLSSFRWVRCAYTHFSNPAHHYLNALRVQQVTAEKVSPSPIDFVALMQQAVAIEQRLERIRGESVDTFICEAQDRARNAHSKSVAAAWNVWSELLQQDQITFEAERISSEKENAKRRSKLVGQLEDMHKKAWDLVASYIKNNLQFFASKAVDAESTVLPEVTSWLYDSLAEIPESLLCMEEVRSVEDHCMVAWANLTTVGVMPAAKWDFILTSVTNLLVTYKRNGKSEKKEEKVEKDEEMKDEADDDEDGSIDDKDDPEEADIRDIKHKLENPEFILHLFFKAFASSGG